MHVHYAHCPPDRQVESHETQEIYAFSLVVCRNSAGKYLVVQEFSGQGFWLPGGRVDPGEDFIDAAVRETKEEAGIDIRLLGILRVEFTPKKCVLLSFFFLLFFSFFYFSFFSFDMIISTPIFCRRHLICVSHTFFFFFFGGRSEFVAFCLILIID